eukprot:SAG31_NODE_3500_length_4192_cov_2.220621_1_plen_96_part_00
MRRARGRARPRAGRGIAIGHYGALYCHCALAFVCDQILPRLRATRVSTPGPQAMPSSLPQTLIGETDTEKMACAGMACCCFILLILVIHGAVAGG